MSCALSLPRAVGRGALVIGSASALTACAGDDGGSSATDSSGGTSTGASATSGSGSDTSGGSGSGSSGGGTSGSSGGSGSGTSGSSGGSGSSTGETTGGVTCDLVPVACAQVEAYGDYVDCGEVDPWDSTLAEWEAARSCALENAAAMKAFKVIVWVQGIDSDVGYAYVGLTAESFEVVELFYDSFGPTLTSRPCAALVATPGCTVSVGDACLGCESDAEPATVCGG